MARGPGRPAQILGDSSELRSARLDLRARVAWLARVSRCASPEPAAARQATFAAKLQEVGVGASSTKVSLWENARQPFTLAELAGYEAVLDLPKGQLQATCEGLTRSLRPDGRQPLQRERALVGGQGLLDTVYDAATRQAATGGDWFALTSYWDHVPGSMVPITIVRQLVSTLLDEMVRSCGTAFVTRFQALCHLADHPVYAQVLVDSVLDFVSVPGVEPVIDALSLLGEGLADQTAPVLLQLGMDPLPRIRSGAVHALTTQIVLGTFPRELRPQLLRLIGSLCAGSLEDTVLARSLLVRLPPEEQAQGRSLLARRARPAGSDTPVPAPRPVNIDLSRYEVAARAATGLPSDPVLHRLLAEAHVHDLLELRHNACLLLMASPYRASLAEVSLAVLLERPGTPASVSAGVLLGYLAVPEQAESLEKALSHPSPAVHQQVLMALTHAVGVPHHVDLNTLTTTPGKPDKITLYAAGMAGHPHLKEWLDEPRQDQEVIDRCRWWLRNGTAIRT